jgi:hypothetical protein
MPRLTYYARNDEKQLSLLFHSKKMYASSLRRQNQPSYLDLWTSKPLYGKIDTNFNVVQSSSAKLQLLADDLDKQRFFALDFVADAFNALKLYFEELEMRGHLRPGSFFHPLNAYSGWRSTNELYERHIKNLAGQFKNSFLTPKAVRHYNSIRRFDDYLPIFVEFLNSLVDRGGLALTRSGFISKTTCPHTVSGLMIDIAKEIDSSDDRRKFVRYFSDSQFSIYMEAVTKFGFYVDMNMPWRLVANLESPAWTASQSPHPLASIKSALFPEGYSAQAVFDQYFTKPQRSEFEEFKTLVLAFYLSFRSDVNIDGRTNITFDLPKICQTRSKRGLPLSVHRKNNKLRTQVVTRENMTMDRMMEKYDDLFWFRLYMQLKLKEMRAPISERQLDHELREIEQIYHSMGGDSVLEYITERMSYYLQKQMGKFLSLYEEGKIPLTEGTSPAIML